MSEFFESLLNSIKSALRLFEPVLILPAAALVFLVMFFLYYKRISGPLAGTTEWIQREINKPKMTFFFRRHRMTQKDIAPLLIITAVFAFLALFKLGDTVAPERFFQYNELHSSVTVETQTPVRIGKLMFYTGLWTGHYTLELSENGVNWIEQKPEEETDSEGNPVYSMDQPHSHLFKWRYATLNTDNPAIKFIRITASNLPMEMGELAIYDDTGNLLPLPVLTYELTPESADLLFNEQEIIPPQPEYMNSMYFDEIYHGRTALEHLRNVRPYETTHPPLGKEIIASSIYLFGMTPFGWRFAGAVFGVIMLAVMYVFLKNMFGKTPVAICGTLLLGFDFMRFTQTRIATIDTYGVFFILLSYFFMYRTITTDPDKTFKKSLLPLAMSGLFFGFGCASKWIVPYAGIGLAAVYIIRLVMLRRYYRANDRPGFSGYLIKTLLFSVLFFIAVPAVIYYLSYIPYGLANNMTIGNGMLWDPDYFKIVIDNQKSMFSYHGKLVATHPYSSWWYQWIVDGRPILYYNSYDGDMRSTFAAFGNPIVWWGGLLAMIAMGIRTIRCRDGKALFIVIGYLSQLLPWVAVSRIVFVYHYFPSTLFLCFAIAHVFNTIIERAQGRCRAIVYGYTAVTGAVFAMFYPALTGVYAPTWYFKYFIRWIPGAWPF